jgi:GWxTD domain-containing protein
VYARFRLPSRWDWIVVAVLAGALPAGARALDLPPLRSESSPQFTADVAISLDAGGAPALAVSVTVANDELQWVRLGGATYGAAAEIVIAFDPRGGGPGYGDAWERRLTVEGFGLANSATAAMVERRTFQVPPGVYEVRVKVHDLNADATSSARERITVPDYSRVPVGFADLQLGTVDDSGRFLLVDTRRFGRNVDRLAARAALFDRRAGSWPRRYPFRWRILDDGGIPVVEGRRDISVPASAEPVIVRPDSTPLFIGAYTFQVELVEDRSKWQVERSFEVEESGPPRGREFTRMLEPLSFIAPAEEIDRLRGLAPEEQARGWEEFWARRDPTPDTPRNEALLEFFRRVRYAEMHFQHFGPGWRSDMGRIYIKFGPPDQTESRAQTSQTPQLEIWYYNRPYRRFVFADQEGFGRFVLISPSAE